MLRKVLSATLFLFAAGVIALGYGVYVYHFQPALVWGLLFLCWACYRLKMRADARFGKRSRNTATSLEEVESPP